jgi:hypothetical protein
MPAYIQHRDQAGRARVVEIADGTTEQLTAGTYELVVPLPWGGVYDNWRPIDVPPGDDTLALTVDVPGELYFTTSPPERPLAKAGMEPRGVSEAWSVRFLRWEGAPTAYVRSRFKPIVKDLPDFEMEHLEGGTTRLTIEATPRSVLAVQVRTLSGQSLVTVLPTTPDASPCRFYVRTGLRGIATAVRLADPVADAMAGYLSAGRPDRALAMASGGSHSLLWSFHKPEVALRSALAGYAALRLGDTDQLRKWAPEFAHECWWLSDSALIAGAVAARDGSVHPTTYWLQQAVQRGIPYFTSGLSLMAAETESLARSHPLFGWSAAFRQIRRLAASADFAAVSSTLQLTPANERKYLPSKWKDKRPTRAVDTKNTKHWPMEATEQWPMET